MHKIIVSAVVTFLMALGAMTGTTVSAQAAPAKASHGHTLTVREIQKNLRTTAGLRRLAKVLPACIYEDGSGQRGPCLWNAGASGNGYGASFVAIPQKRGHMLYVYRSSVERY